MARTTGTGILIFSSAPIRTAHARHLQCSRPLLPKMKHHVPRETSFNHWSVLGLLLTSRICCRSFRMYTTYQSRTFSIFEFLFPIKEVTLASVYYLEILMCLQITFIDLCGLSGEYILPI